MEYDCPMGNESAVIIPIPEVEPIVGPLRLHYDRAAHLGVPAHITLLYPFCPPQTVSAEIKTLARIIREWEEIGRQKKPPLLQTC
jgi:hypothetical protein